MRWLYDAVAPHVSHEDHVAYQNRVHRAALRPGISLAQAQALVSDQGLHLTDWNEGRTEWNLDWEWRRQETEE